MHSTLHPISFFHLSPLSFKSPETLNPILISPKFCSLRISLHYEPEGVFHHERLPPNTTPLPILIKRSGRVSRYFSNGDCLELVHVDRRATSFCGGFRRLIRFSSSALRDFFMPKQVDENYMGYVKWKFLHRVFSSALQVLATQAMFRAIGIGQSRSLPSAAAFNWILKEGLGRLSRCIYTASLASAFDTNLKRVRFSTSIVFSLSVGVELLTPVFPQYFLLLASIANIARQISLSCYLATGVAVLYLTMDASHDQSAVHRSFAVADNLGEISAKSQIQTVCFDNLGLLLAAVLDILFKSNQRLQARLPFVVYPLFSMIDLLGIYQGLKHVHLQTLTKDRLEIILEKWVELGRVPSPSEVSKEEGIDLLRVRDSKRFLTIRIGCLDPKGQIPRLSMVAMQSFSSDGYYFITIEISAAGLTRTRKPGIVVCLREGAGTADVVMGLLQACHIRRALRSNGGEWKKPTLEEWRVVMEESKRCAGDDFVALNEEMEKGGWAVKNILLSREEEEVRYSFVR